jgi:hypothetical protein
MGSIRIQPFFCKIYRGGNAYALDKITNAAIRPAVCFLNERRKIVSSFLVSALNGLKQKALFYIKFFYFLLSHNLVENKIADTA